MTGLGCGWFTIGSNQATHSQNVGLSTALLYHTSSPQLGEILCSFMKWFVGICMIPPLRRTDGVIATLPRSSGQKLFTAHSAPFMSARHILCSPLKWSKYAKSWAFCMAVWPGMFVSYLRNPNGKSQSSGSSCSSWVLMEHWSFPEKGFQRIIKG